jgi:hypothetical protein
MIILITVAAIGILWAAIIPMIQTNLDFSSLQGRVSVLEKGYTAYDDTQKIASVQVKRDVDEGVMDRIKITFEVNGNSHSSIVVAPESGGTKVYTFDMTGIGEPDSVSVAPIFAVGNKEKEGEITSTIDIPKSRISEAIATYETGKDYESEGEALLYHAELSSHSAGNGYYYRMIRSVASDYTIVSGDKFEYSVYCLKSSVLCYPAVEIEGTEGTAWTSRGIVTDQNGLSLFKDCSDYANDKWYHREFDLTSAVGKSIDEVSLVFDPAPNELAYNLDIVLDYYYRDIVITNGGAVKKILWAGGSLEDNTENYANGGTGGVWKNVGVEVLSVPL